MISKNSKLKIIIFSAVILLGNFCFIADSIAFYTYRSTTPLWVYPLGRQFVNGVAISSDGTYITAICDNNPSSIYDPDEGILYLFNNSISKNKTPLWNYSILNSFYSVDISSDGRNIVVGGDPDDKTVYLFNSSHSTPQWTYNTGDWVYDVRISDDGSYLAVASGSRRVFFFNTSEASPISIYYTTGRALRVAISSNGDYLSATDNALKIYFYNTSKSSPEWTYTISGDMGSKLSISSDGNYIVGGCRNVLLFNKTSSIPLWNKELSDDMGSIKISKDGDYIVVGGDYNDYNVYFLNRSNPNPEWTYTTRDSIVSVDISDNGDYIIAHGLDQFVYLFSKNSSTPIWKYKLDSWFSSSRDYSLGISSDGKYIVAAGRHYIYLFDRDIITPRQIIEGYGTFITILTIVIIILVVVVAVFPFKNKIKRNSHEEN
ncbi:MAG: WD40 repeat domain-containing protein [Promethearchaeota archaeon]